MKDISRTCQAKTMGIQKPLGAALYREFMKLIDTLTHFTPDAEMKNVLSAVVITSDLTSMTAVVTQDEFFIQFENDCLRTGISGYASTRYVHLFGDSFTVEQKELIEKICEIFEIESFFNC